MPTMPIRSSDPCVKPVFLPILIALLTLLLGACTNDSGDGMGIATTVDPIADAPEDFSIDCTVLSRTAEPIRIVLFANGALHHGQESGRGSQYLPDLVRKLDRNGMTGIWARAQNVGLNTDAGQSPTNPAFISPPASGQRIVLFLTGQGNRRMFVHDVDGDEIDPYGEFLDELLKQAWATEQTMRGRVAAPRRYNFGPDPYARYR